MRHEPANAHPTHLSDAVEHLCRRLGLAELYVFGSRGSEIAARVRGVLVGGRERDTRSSDSDVDVGVRPLPGRRVSVDDLVVLAGELERMLDVPRVDVVLLPSAPPSLALDVVRGELVFCADAEAQAEYELYVLRRAGDLAPFQRARHELVLSRGGAP